jgi:DNA repair exonuclease SbcCD ATPase subunit
MAAKIISILASNYGFDAEEAMAYYMEHKSEAGSTTSMTTVQRAENAISKTQAKIEELKAKMPEKKGKLLEKANESLKKLEEKLEEQTKKLEAKKAKEAAPKKPKKEPKTAPDAAKKPADEKRIKRMSPALTKSLTKVFEEASLTFAKEDGQAFAKYVNEMAQDDFNAVNLETHMRDFATIKKKPAPPKEEDAPVADPDEDLVEVVFKGTKYVVGEISNRVYIANEEEGDQFVGHRGVGKFKDMKMPA